MAVNRFVNINWDKPISSFVPLPFEAAYLAGERIQKDVDDKLSKLSTSTDPFSKLDFSSSFKIFDPTNPLARKGVVDYDFGSTLGKQRDMVVNSLAAEREQLVNDWDSGKITNDEFSKRVSKHVNKATQLHGVLKNAEDRAKSIKEISKKLIEDKDYNLQNHLAVEEIKYNTDWLNNLGPSLQQGIIPDYNPFGIAAKTDVAKEVKDYFGSLGKEVLNSTSGPTGIGYIRTHYREGVTKDKILDRFLQWYDTSPVKNDIKLEGYDFAYRNNIEPEQEITVNVPDHYDPKAKKMVYKKEKRKWIDDFEEKRFNEVKDLALGFTESSGRDALSADALFIHQDKMRRIDEQLVSSPADVEADASVAYDAIPDNIKEFINSKGDIDMSKFINDNKNQINWTFKDKNGKTYDLTTEGNGKIDSKSGWYWKTPANQELKNKGYKFKERPDGYIEVYDKNNNYIGKSDANKGVTQNVVNSKLESIHKWAVDRGSKLGLDISANESKQSYTNRIIKEVMNQSKNVSVNKKIDASIAKNMDEDLVGKDGSKFSVNYDDVIVPGQSGTKPIAEFIQDYDVNPASIKHASVTFDKSKPGYILFSATDKKDPNKSIQFYAKSKNLSFVNKTKDVSNFIDVFKDFYKGNIKSKKLNIKDESYTILDKEIAKPTDKENVMLALDKNRVPIVLIESKNKGKSQYITMPINTLKNESYKRYFDSPEAKEYTRDIRESKNWMLQTLLSGDENIGE